MDDALRNWIIDFGEAGYVVRHCINHQYVTILRTSPERSGFLNLPGAKLRSGTIIQ